MRWEKKKEKERIEFKYNKRSIHDSSIWNMRYYIEIEYSIIEYIKYYNEISIIIISSLWLFSIGILILIIDSKCKDKYTWEIWYFFVSYMTHFS